MTRQMKSAHALVDSWPTLKLLHTHRRSPAITKVLLNVFSNDKKLCSCMRIIAKNLKNGVIKVRGSKAKQLRAYKTKICALAGHKNRNQAKLVRQAGGWAGAVIPLVAAFIPEIIRLIANK